MVTLEHLFPLLVQVRSHGVRAVRQMLASCWEDCEDFLQDWNPDPFKAVVKPLESAGSDDVYLCHSVDDVREAFSIIDGKVKYLYIIIFHRCTVKVRYSYSTIIREACFIIDGNVTYFFLSVSTDVLFNSGIAIVL